jgi:hypothetical protein
LGLTVSYLRISLEYMTTPTPSTRQVLTEQLHPWLRGYVRAERAAGTSWRRIVRAVYERTDGNVDVTEETMRTWFRSMTEVSS